MAKSSPPLPRLKLRTFYGTCTLYSAGMSAQAIPPKIPLVFYRSAGGGEPVRDWLRTMDREDRLAIGADLLRVQYRWPVGMRLCRALKGGLWEVRTSLPSRKIARVMICFHGGLLIALHGFVKKTQKTPDEDMAIARKRRKEVENG